jgi:nucleotide-binding universal stress UspA family protein
LPLLSRAKSVEVVTFEADGSDSESPGGIQLGLLFARHGIKVELLRERPNADIADALLAWADDRGADLLVMGCYGHTRLREILLGGVSRTILRCMTIPTLMAH